MYLKKIDLNGFKSFANRTEFPINQGITAIVGPNGSGKSNVIDGIKWVLGEQSAKSLRGSKMEDIIFAGSEGKRQKNYAEVSLIFDNNQGVLPLDYSEVSITRRIFRDGESEYYINKNNCRLKDIHELFMDTGIGKEAYSIISQGQVEEILNSRPEEKRIIFEEAAGIVKYKNKKKESLKKLDETEQNLVRVDDILYQLEQDLPQVQEEANKAEKYRHIKDKLKELEVSLILQKLDDLDRQYIDTDKLIDEKKQLQGEVDKAISLTQNNKEKLQCEQKNIEEQYNLLRDEELDTIKKLEELKYTLQLNKQQVTEGKKKIEQLKFDNVELENYLKENKGRKEDTQSKISQSKSDIISKRQELEDEEACSKALQKELVQDQKLLEDLKEEVIGLLGTIATIKNELKNLENNKARLISEQTRKDRELESLKQKNNAINNRVELLTGLVNKLERDYGEKEQSSKSLNSEIQACEENLNMVKDKLELKKNNVNELSSRIKGLVNLEQSFAGYNLGPKEALKKFKGHSKLEGSVAQLIEVPEFLTNAIEIALGNSLQHLVVQDEGFASEVIEYLKSKKLGRATFLPLNIVRGNSLNIEDPEIVGIASKLLKYDKKYQGIIDFLLGRIIIVKDLKAGHKIAKKFGYKYRVVSLEGDVVNAGGAITGGKYNSKSTGLLQRSVEIDHLKEELSAEEKQYGVFHKEFSLTNQKILKLKEQMDAMNIELSNLKDQKNSGNQQLLLAKQELNSLQQHISLVEDEKKLLDNDIKIVEEKIMESEKLHQEKTTGQQEISLKINSLNDQLTEKSDGFEKLKSKIVSKQITVASLEQELQSMKKELAMLADEEKRTFNRFNTNKSNIETYTENIIKLEESIKSLTSKQMHLEESKIELTKKQNKNNNLKRALEEELEVALTKIRELEQSKELLTAKTNSLNLKKSKLIMELDSLTEKLLSEYFLTVGEAKDKKLPKVVEKEATKEINILREDLKGLGDVNIGAIEECKKIINKISFLEEQKSDLNKAKLDLKKIILEMDRQMASQFENSFERIKEFFNEVFQKLFNGGRGYLRLTDPDNILESGVEIFVQPPGKKLQSMTLLSGGEKALTAIALLFAILKTRPSPFCVLDEIEASLDEANVDRFGAFLKEMATDSQFIVVTHRKGTMECADILYGITMEENGISKQISVNLDKKVG